MTYGGSSPVAWWSALRHEWGPEGAQRSHLTSFEGAWVPVTTSRPSKRLNFGWSLRDQKLQNGDLGPKFQSPRIQNPHGPSGRVWGVEYGGSHFSSKKVEFLTFLLARTCAETPIWRVWAKNRGWECRWGEGGGATSGDMSLVGDVLGHQGARAAAVARLTMF